MIQFHDTLGVLFDCTENESESLKHFIPALRYKHYQDGRFDYKPYIPREHPSTEIMCTMKESGKQETPGPNFILSHSAPAMSSLEAAVPTEPH